MVRTNDPGASVRSDPQPAERLSEIIFIPPRALPGPQLVIAIAKSSMRSWPLKLSRRP